MRSWLVLVVLAVVFGGIVSRQVPGFADGLAARATHGAPAAPATVAAVAFDGKGLPLAQLRDAVATRAGSVLDDATLAGDRDLVRATLVARGYLDASVDTAVTRLPRGAYVSFAVTPGALYHVGRVRVVNARTDRHPVVTIASGDEALASSIDDARAHVGAAATAQLRADRARATVDIDLVAP
jgi:hypothetical protein|nr:POTRA domain-containing protein [Kofleriaceae bacterium]